MSLVGPGAKRMTFGHVLCEECNGGYTQPFDRAYERLAAWYVANRLQLLEERQIDFAQVYGPGWESSQLDLFRYFAKHLGCNIASCDGHQVPEDLRVVLQEATFRTAFCVTFNVHEDLLLGPDLDTGLWLDALGYYAADESGIPGYFSGITIGWLWVRFWYGMESIGSATEWIADRQIVHLGALSVLTETQREEVRRRGKGLPHSRMFDGDA